MKKKKQKDGDLKTNPWKLFKHLRLRGQAKSILKKIPI